MSEIRIEEFPSLNGTMIETENSVKNIGANNEHEETWFYEKNTLKNDGNIDNTTAPSIDEVTTQEIDATDEVSTSIPTTTSFLGSQIDDDDDDSDDEVEITIGNYEPETSTYQITRQKNRGILATGSLVPSKPSVIRGVDLDTQGVINGHSTYEYDISTAYKDEEKPWKKPGADITDYFNYSFTEETWIAYCDRQRHLRSENNFIRLNPTQIPHMPPMFSGQSPMIHRMNPHSVMMANRSVNFPMMARPMNSRRPDGKINVIGTTDQTSRRQMFESLDNFEHSPFTNDSLFSDAQRIDGRTVGDDLASTSIGPLPYHGMPTVGTLHMSTMNVHRLPMMPLPHGIQFRPPFGHSPAHGRPQFPPQRPAIRMSGDRHPAPYFIPQQLWDKNGVPLGHGFPPQTTTTSTTDNGEDASRSRSPTPEENSLRGVDHEKSIKEDRYKEKYRDDRDHHPSSRRRSSVHHRNNEHEYERPRNYEKSSRDRDDKYERHSRKRHRDSSHSHRDDEKSSHSHRTVIKNGSSPSNMTSSLPASIESSQILSTQPLTTELNQTSTSLRRDDSEHSSTRHSHHKKSSKRPRHDS